MVKWLQDSASMIENINCQTKEIGMDNIIWRNGTRKGKGGKISIWAHKKSQSRGHMIYISDAHQVSSNSLVQNPFLPPCYYKWVSLRAAFHLSESEIGRENQPICSTAIPAFKHLCHRMLTQLTAVACAGVGRKPAANNKDWATAHLGSQLKGINFVY